ncbi:DNA-directed RNA polymerase subunit omega [bacterium]|nr:DNA-directed RNA polymerase subunit omega [FCB group bacterium]MBL7190417.1 DNA-directed RNA polymerase subunit omega [bacterium]
MDKDYFLAEDFCKETSNVYEAVTVIARRARKIASDQRLEIEKITSLIESEEETEDKEKEEEQADDTVIDFEKPTMIAMRELQAGELEFDYSR